MSQAFHDTFLEELTRLDAYLGELGGRDQAAPSSADPEVRRLLEAVAFFAARTQEVAYRGAFDAVSSLVAEHCEFIRRPLVARGMVQAEDAGGWATAIHLPQGTPFLVESSAGEQSRFSTAMSAVLAPLSVFDVKVETTAEARWLLLGVSAPAGFSRIDWLSLYVDVLGDWGRSLLLHRRLSRACRSARYVRCASAPDSSTLHALPELQVRFGARQGDIGDEVPSPLDAARTHFQFPQQDLFMNVELPSACNDTRAWIALELDPRGDELRVSKNAFRTNVLPLENKVRAPAQPIASDGRVMGHWVLPPAELSGANYGRSPVGYELLEIERVSELDGAHEVTLFPSSLGEPERSYRLAWQTQGGRTRPLLGLGVPGTLEKPRHVRVDAAWTQVGFDLRTFGRARARAWRLGTPDVSFRLSEVSAPFVESPVRDAPDKLLELAALRNRSPLGRNELVRLLRLLSVGGDPLWERLIDSIETLRWREVPAQEASDGTKLEVTLRSRAPSAELESPLGDLVDWATSVLNAWCDEPVKVRLETSLVRAPLRLAGAGV
jgi:type VI secretion system protein ImpG